MKTKGRRPGEGRRNPDEVIEGVAGQIRSRRRLPANVVVQDRIVEIEEGFRPLDPLENRVAGTDGFMLLPPMRYASLRPSSTGRRTGCPLAAI